jgi:hypothetical protein
MEGGICAVKTNNHQIFIEGSSSQLFIYIYLTDFKKENALSILDSYILRFENMDFKKLKVLFWNKGIPGEFLSMFRKNINRKCTRLLLRGVSYIEASFDYLNKSKILNNPITIN